MATVFSGYKQSVRVRPRATLVREKKLAFVDIMDFPHIRPHNSSAAQFSSSTVYLHNNTLLVSCFVANAYGSHERRRVMWSIKYISNICIVVVYWFKCGVKANPPTNWVVGAFVIVLCILPAQQVPIQEEYRIIKQHGSLYIIYWDWNHTHAAACSMSISWSFRLGALARAMGPT